MASVIGVGGIFFKSNDPKSLGEWYKAWLNVPYSQYGANFKPDGLPANALSVWTPFDQDTQYFNPSTQPFMINLIVDNLDEALEQVTRGGAQVMSDREDGEYGQFGWFIDPDGNKVELWQPPKQAPQ